MMRLGIAALLLCLAASLPASVTSHAVSKGARRQVAGEAHAKTFISALKWPPYQDEAVRLLQDYLRIDTSNPPGNEVRAAEFFKKLFDNAGVPNTTYEYLPGRADFYAVLKGDGSLRPIVLLSHMDVVRAQPQNWKEPPFSGAILDGDIYGRGAEDMKDQGLLNAMVLLIAAREHLPLKRDLIFLATADEEVNDTGSEWLIDHHPELVRGAEYLITEGGSNLITPGRGLVYGIDVAEKAPFWLRLTATGPGGHGSIPISDSAPNRLVRALNRVVNWETPVHLLPSVEEYFHQLAAREPQPLAGRFRNIRESINDPAFVKVISSDSDLNYRIRDTVSLTGLQGSPQTNVIPDTATANLDVRLLPGDDPLEFLREIRAVVNDDHIRIDPITTFRPPNASPTDTALYSVIEQVVHEYSPQALITPELDSGYTENQMYRPLGIVCYGFLPVELKPEVEATEHAANERIPVEQVRRGLKMIYEVIARIENP
ncbi:MAG TPA: M20/M25/M40 family metallo-hydrolase [Terriglobia bacterium]|nr:M20/M25/M40 family metallo-hydrolase [Terriglobia bacterium]